jgi:hypothetical protein
MKTRGLVSSIVALCTLLAADIAVHLASPAKAQPFQPEPLRWVTGICNTNYGNWIYRSWSDGVVEVRDMSTRPVWTGWRNTERQHAVGGHAPVAD